MVYIKKEKPNGNITADIKAYYQAYYQAKKVRKVEPKPVGYVEETGEIIVWVGLDVIKEKAYRKKIRKEMIWADLTEDFSGLKGFIYEVGYE